jgi:RNA polymerase sigma-54 factor
MDQRMKLAPRMIQSMEILQMPALALEERIEQELCSNPTLEMKEPGSDDETVEAELEQTKRDDREGERELVVGETPEPNATGADDFERLTNLSEEYGDSWDANTSDTSESFRRVRETGERDKKLDAMANTAARPECLAEQLLDQWRMVETTPRQREAGEYLIGFIDGDGYLRTDMPTLLRQAPAGLTADDLEQALKLLQTALEPVGLGARDLRECFLLQIDARIAQVARSVHDNGNAALLEELAVQRLLVSDYLKDIEANRLPKIAKSAGLTLDAIKQALVGLRQYHPHPGRMLVDVMPQTIQPDAIVEYDEQQDRYVATLTNGRGSNLTISPKYMKMARDASIERKTREFVGQNLRSARWLLDAIRQRHHTLLRVIHVVTEAQREFFEHGPQALKPLPMTLVADQLGIHVATVSRAVHEKYIQTPRGIFPLRMFFSGGTETESGDAMSWAAVQAKLQEVVDAEDKANPLNDDELVEKLKEKGIEIARRTVAKYRKQLNIAPARQRREY